MKTKTINHISKETADFILDNFGLLTMGLIVNEDFRNTFVEAVAIEIALDDMVEVRDDRVEQSKQENEGCHGRDRSEREHLITFNILKTLSD